jgi:DUF971 family protein
MGLWHGSRMRQDMPDPLPLRPTMVPTEIRLERGRSRLAVTWEDGSTDAFPAPLLREKARDANSVRFAVNGWAVPAPADLTITAVEPIGNYAVRLAFSDGHDQGIFPWAYLTEIAVDASDDAVAAS